ncbi:hypothetical protein HanRHA438_Chr08g0362401 [Helianthus annuus]|uniref:Uncharacterized protein n=1 Tax=Helianthus annuus TaxID=4232 RepID=A0A251U8H1_HELAN|nr:hypothetical protein HanXRQr2_Chr08g0350211 [Helianthus annuus]KAJ0539667.1 hypothetical protein HanHA300_Chr08g0289011 [Helianthus annuus]KAJ0554397.1 hypothetical protein HanHA89_Chr08g0307321 [Helianthus annuus]KAJ0898926.1 hypothetical protein HanRHA438_Chr08g0362401 [Helianthus annuus]
MRDESDSDPSRILYPTTSSPLLGQILPLGMVSLLTKKNRRFQLVSFFVTLKTG